MTERPKPSQIDIGLDEPHPLMGAFQRVEAEVCAALIVESCRARGDTWQPVGVGDVHVAASGIEERCKAESRKAPTWFLVLGRIDVHTLIRLGAVEWSDVGAGTVEPTAHFFDRIRPYVRGPHRPTKVNIVLDPKSDDDRPRRGTLAAAAAQAVLADIVDTEEPARGAGPGKR